MTTKSTTATAVLSLGLAVLLAASASTQQPQQANQQERENINTVTTPTDAFLFSAEDVAAHRTKLQNVAYANITVIQRSDPNTPSGIAYRMAVDRRRPPQRAATHPNEGELWAIIDGAGEITTGGKIVETKTGDTVNRTITGGTVHKVKKGDFLVIPENVPHHVTAFTPELVMVTFEYPRGFGPRR
jgi:mannose-6-phosphate isomerase-like protein (cupin superfamily)